MGADKELIGYGSGKEYVFNNGERAMNIYRGATRNADVMMSTLENPFRYRMHERITRPIWLVEKFNLKPLPKLYVNVGRNEIAHTITTGVRNAILHRNSMLSL